MNTTVISGRLVRNPGYNEVENEKGLHKIAKFVLAVRRNYSDEVSFIPVKAFAKKRQYTDHTGGRDLLQFCRAFRSPSVWRSGAYSGGIRGNPQA